MIKVENKNQNVKRKVTFPYLGMYDNKIFIVTERSAVSVDGDVSWSYWAGENNTGELERHRFEIGFWKDSIQTLIVPVAQGTTITLEQKD